ncbi:MAG: N-acetylmuramoyl-L-alanine amidase [Terriglobales bacterium]
MLSRTLIRGGRAFRLGATLLLVLLPFISASARVHHNDTWARRQFATAERTREALNGRPLGERTRHEYQRVIDSYRSVYFGSPASPKADPSVVATAELMVEMGRRFEDDKILRGAVEQYHFLRKEYPGSKYRFEALFTIGEIYKDDLNDPEEARITFVDFARRYPHNRLADDARAAVKEIDTAADEMEHAAQKQAAQKQAHKRSSGDASNAGASSAGNVNASADGESSNAARRSALPRVTGVRHWSTPDYTRVAIDVEQEVKFGSQRISNPDRIFFDLRDTKLASTLVGKTFDVDDGFLKKIRVAEFEPGRTRIVLEVDDLASYDAFLLPDPYRLIIDIHGKQKRGTLLAKAEAASVEDRSIPDTSATRSLDSDDDSGGDLKSNRKDQQPSVVTKPVNKAANKKAATGSSKQGLVETDLPAESANTDTTPLDSAKPTNGNGVIKTTVAVKGSNRRIPKTIVPADNDADDHADNGANRGDVDDNRTATVATFDREKLRAEVTTGRDTDISNTDETARAKPDSSAPLASSSSHSSQLSQHPSPRLSQHQKKSRAAAPPAATDDADLLDTPESREARPTAAGDRSLTRALGLKIGKIVIDAGHGGHDTGTIGPNGLLEKDVVLDVAKRLGRLLETRLGAEVVYTRRDDTFVPLETRTAIANRERADLFISIHANSSQDSDARGVETYYLNFTSSPEALEVAARENAVSEKSIHELQDLVKKIALKEKIEESREFAGDVQESLYGGLALNNAGIRDRGVKKAPFIVLIGANMPSILAEISFVSNPTDERKMETSEHRQRIAESLYRGVSKYVNGLSGVKVASKIDKREGQ